MGSVYRVTYGAHGNEGTVELADPQEDGIPAERKALDYCDAALSSPPDVRAWCAVLKDGEEWLDTRWP